MKSRHFYLVNNEMSWLLFLNNLEIAISKKTDEINK